MSPTSLDPDLPSTSQPRYPPGGLGLVTAASRRPHSAGGNGEANTAVRGLNAPHIHRTTPGRGLTASLGCTDVGYRGKPAGTVTR